MLQSVKDYLATKPKYQSKYYTGYPDDEYGVCTDVVAFGMLNAGYDLMSLVYDDVWANREMYDIEIRILILILEEYKICKSFLK